MGANEDNQSSPSDSLKSVGLSENSPYNEGGYRDGIINNTSGLGNAQGEEDEDEDEEDLPFPSPPSSPSPPTASTASEATPATPTTNSGSPGESSDEEPTRPLSQRPLDAEELVEPTLEQTSVDDTPSSPNIRSFAGQKFVLSGTGTEVYVTHSPSQRTPRLVILLTNSLGLGSSNNLRMADEYAKKLNCPVIVPDLFDKDPIRVSGADIPELDNEEDGLLDGGSEDASDINDSTSRLQPTPQTKHPTSFFSNLTLSKVKSFAASTIKGFFDEMWLAKHTFERTYPQLTNTIAEIVQVYSPQSLAVIGYSFGGRYVLRLLEDQHHDEWSSEEDLIAVGACIHPSLVEESDFEVVKKPLMLVYSTDDPIVSDKVFQKGISSLQDRNVRFDHKVFSSSNIEGTKHQKLPHGFAVLGDYPESVVGNTPNQVIGLVSDWIQVHLSE